MKKWTDEEMMNWQDKLPFKESIHDILGRCKCPVGGQKDADISRFQFPSLRSQRTDELSKCSASDDANLLQLPLEPGSSLIIHFQTLKTMNIHSLAPLWISIAITMNIHQHCCEFYITYTSTMMNFHRGTIMNIHEYLNQWKFYSTSIFSITLQWYLRGTWKLPELSRYIHSYTHTYYLS